MMHYLSYAYPRWGSIEMRAMLAGKVVQHWYDANSRDWLIEEAHELDLAGWDIYIGVLPRLRHGGTEDDVYPFTDILWADVDAKNGRTKAQAFGDIHSFGVPPTSVVDSGNGYHLTWRLTRQVPFDQARAVMQGIAKQLHGDAVYDAPRILRLPGTHNHKHGGNLPVRLLVLDTIHRYDLGDFGDLRYVPRRIEIGRDGFKRNVYAFGLGDAPLPVWLGVLVDVGAPRGERSEAIYHVVRGLQELGWGDDDIASLISARPLGIGEKLTEMSELAAARWLERTLAKGRAAA